MSEGEQNTHYCSVCRGHAEPRIMGKPGNAIEIENSIWLEVYEKSEEEQPLQRMPDKTHETHGRM